MTGDPRVLDLPAFSLVLLIGASGSGKSAFAAKHFLPTEVVSSDACRAMVADDPDDQAASDDAFALLEFIVATRLRAGRLTVIDATNARRQDRARLIALGREKGDAIALLSSSRAEWVQADFAIFSTGGITVPIYPSYPPDLVAYVGTRPPHWSALRILRRWLVGSGPVRAVAEGHRVRVIPPASHSPANFRPPAGLRDYTKP